MRAIDSLIVIGYQCQVCGAFASSYDEIRDHVRRKHTNRVGEKIDALVQVGFSCQECGVFHRTYPQITEHIRTFHNELVRLARPGRTVVAREVRQP